MNGKVIKAKAEYNKALKRSIAILQAEPGTSESDELELLLVLIEDYEDKHIVMPEADRNYVMGKTPKMNFGKNSDCLIEISDENVEALHSLIGESTRGGYHFLQRTIDDWYSGANRFDRSGEKLWGVFMGEDLIGIGGLNIDPYIVAPKIGRIRHLYVREARRREGFATLLMRKIIEEASYNFTVLRVFTNNADAGTFYEKLGFKQAAEYKASHFITLPLASLPNE